MTSGIEGVGRAISALEWAVREAERRGHCFDGRCPPRSVADWFERYAWPRLRELDRDHQPTQDDTGLRIRALIHRMAALMRGRDTLEGRIHAGLARHLDARRSAQRA